MADPFLQGHQVRPRVYDLGRRAPISIRDQLVRSHHLADRLFDAGIVHAGDDMLVVGAGVAGVSTAVLCARRGASVVLVDARGGPFGWQHACRTRWIDPVQYDWPAVHSAAARWPLKGAGPSPLGFEAGWASAIATEWARAFALERLAAGTRLRVFYGVSITTPRPVMLPTGTRRVAVTVTPTSGPALPPFYGAVVFARGFQLERTEVPYPAPAGTHVYSGVKFWDNDTFTQPNFGQPPHLAGKVLISGSGDGALQDYVRLTTGHDSVIELFDTLLPPRGATLRLRWWVAHQIAGIDLDTRHALLWCEGDAQDHYPLLAAHRRLQLFVQRLRDVEPIVWAGMVRRLAEITAARQPFRVELRHGCLHFSAGYVLNQFMVLLLAEIFEELHPGVKTVVGGSRVYEVAPATVSGAASHVCAPGCWGHQHQVRLYTDHSCLAAATAKQRLLYDSVVVRHGIVPAGIPGVIRQVPPAHLHR